jgi:pentatricopeptide repeat protein
LIYSQILHIGNHLVAIAVDQSTQKGSLTIGSITPKSSLPPTQHLTAPIASLTAKHQSMIPSQTINTRPAKQHQHHSSSVRPTPRVFYPTLDPAAQTFLEHLNARRFYNILPPSISATLRLVASAMQNKHLIERALDLEAVDPDCASMIVAQSDVTFVLNQLVAEDLVEQAEILLWRVELQQQVCQQADSTQKCWYDIVLGGYEQRRGAGQQSTGTNVRETQLPSDNNQSYETAPSANTTTTADETDNSMEVSCQTDSPDALKTENARFNFTITDKQPNTFCCCNKMLALHVSRGRVHDAIALVQSMSDRESWCRPDDFTKTTLVRAFRDAGDFSAIQHANHVLQHL